MGTPQHKRIGISGANLRQIPFEHSIGHGVIEQALLHQRDQKRASHAGHTDVGAGRLQRAGIGAAADRGFGSDHGNVPAARRGQRCLHTGPDHTLDRNRQDIAQPRQSQSGRRVAGDNDHLCTLGHKHGGDFLAVTFDGGAGFSAVGDTCRVTEINDVFPGQFAAQRAHHGEPPDAGVEDGNGLIGTRRLGGHHRSPRATKLSIAAGLAAGYRSRRRPAAG